jgi:hypothetical protein
MTSVYGYVDGSVVMLFNTKVVIEASTAVARVLASAVDLY